MPNFAIYLSVFSTVLTLAILGALWLLHSKIIDRIESRYKETLLDHAWIERSLRSHVVDEMNQLQEHTVELAANTLGQLHRTEKVIVDFVKDHADDLRKHAAEIKAHSIETHDRAVSRDIAPRQAVTRT